jgi:adenine phosphoribosyltransferase
VLEQPGSSLADLIRNVADFPKPGVGFKDITPLLQSPSGFAAAIEAMVTASPRDVDVVLGMEARGFVFAAPIALALGAGLILVRKPGKLPMPTLTQSYDLEYGANTLAVHADAVRPGARALIVDDVLATGGTILAAARLIKALGAEPVQTTVLLELEFLHGREHLRAHGVDRVATIMSYGAP